MQIRVSDPKIMTSQEINKKNKQREEEGDAVKGSERRGAGIIWAACQNNACGGIGNRCESAEAEDKSGSAPPGPGKVKEDV